MNNWIKYLSLFSAGMLATSPLLAQTAGLGSGGSSSSGINALGAAPSKRVVSHFTVTGNSFAPTKGEAAYATASLGVAALPTVQAAGSACTSNGAQVLTGSTGSGVKFTLNVTITANALASVNSIATAGAYYVPPTSLAAEPVTGDGCVGAAVILTGKLGVNSPALGTWGYSAVSSTPAVSGSGCNSASSQYAQAADASAGLAGNIPAQFRATIAGGTLTSIDSVSYSGSYLPGQFPANTSNMAIQIRSCVGAAINGTFGQIAVTGDGGADYSGTPTVVVVNAAADSTGSGAGGNGVITGTAISSFTGWSAGTAYTAVPTIVIKGPAQSGGYGISDNWEMDVNPDTAPNGGFSSSQAIFCNFSIGGVSAAGSSTIMEYDGINPITVTAAIEYPVGVSPAIGSVTQMTWLGNPKITIQPGQCAPPSDAANGVYVPPATAYNVLDTVSCTGVGCQWPIGTLGTSRSGTAYVSGTAQIQPTSANMWNMPIGKNSLFTNFHYGPLAIIAPSKTPAVIMYGASLTVGFRDNDCTDHCGSLARAIGYNFGYLKVATTSDSTAAYFTSTQNKLQAGHRLGIPLEYFTHAIPEVQRNDLNVASGSFAAAQTKYRQLFSFLKAHPWLKVYPTTATPQSTSTDNWSTVAGQTGSTGWVSNGGFLQYDAEVRTCGTGAESVYCDGYIEYNYLVDAGQDTGLFAVTSANPPQPNLTSYEGAHYADNAAGSFQVVTALSSVAAAGSGGGANGSCTFLGATGTPVNNSGTLAANFIGTGTIASGALTGPLTLTNTGLYTVAPTASAGAVTGTGSCSGLAAATVNLTSGNSAVATGYSAPATGTPWGALQTNLQSQITAILNRQ